MIQSVYRVFDIASESLMTYLLAQQPTPPCGLVVPSWCSLMDDSRRNVPPLVLSESSYFGVININHGGEDFNILQAPPTWVLRLENMG